MKAVVAVAVAILLPFDPGDVLVAPSFFAVCTRAAAATKCVPGCSSGSSSANRTGDDEVDVDSEDIKNSVCVLEIQIPLHFHALLRRPALIVYTLFNHDGWLALL